MRSPVPAFDRQSDRRRVAPRRPLHAPVRRAETARTPIRRVAAGAIHAERCAAATVSRLHQRGPQHGAAFEEIAMKLVTKLGLVVFAGLVATACAMDATPSETVDSENLQASSLAPLQSAVGTFNTNILAIDKPLIPSNNNICLALNGATFKTTVGGCTTTTTLSNCSYNSGTGACDCTSTNTRSGTC
jgi:hypothetical protein